MNVTSEQIWQALEEVKDPEIPVVSVVEMGIVRDVKVSGEGVKVTMTPTFSGCPALDVMRQEILARVREMGVEQVEVKTVYHPPWSSDWITAEAREKLRRFGLAPPPRHGSSGGGNVAMVAFFDAAVCPRCDSTNTTLKNSFGPTLCRMIWYCHDCQDAFEQFKPL
jgi:ring-1,2-phenylacetyl-CoA epoxidase subunit PaaD